MEKSAQTIKKFTANLLRYLVYFTFVVVTPILTKPIAPLFDWAGYGQLRDAFARLFTCIFWVVEIVAIIIVESRIKKSREKKLRAALDVDGTLSAALQNGEALKPALDTIFRTWTDAKPYEDELPPKKEKGKKRQKVKEAPLPLLNVFLLTVISSACILLVSVQTEFQVKPIYDIGEKVTGHQLLGKIGTLACNVIMCIWIVFFLHVCYGMAESLTKGCKEKWLTWLISGAFLMVFGAMDAFSRMGEFSWTYLLFYAVFTLVYCLTKRSGSKTFGLVLLIYIF